MVIDEDVKFYKIGQSAGNLIFINKILKWSSETTRRATLKE